MRDDRDLDDSFDLTTTKKGFTSIKYRNCHSFDENLKNTKTSCLKQIPGQKAQGISRDPRGGIASCRTRSDLRSARPLRPNVMCNLFRTLQSGSPIPKMVCKMLKRKIGSEK